jgi:PelA/Pel-15E family pectate lyase
MLTYRAALSSLIVTLVAALGAGQCHAAQIGVNPPAQSLTRERILTLPAAQQRSWLAYLAQSQKQRQADKDAFTAELKQAGVATPIEPPHDFSARSIPLDRNAAWYSGPEAGHIAQVIVSFQTPAGGWGKNLDMSKLPRQPGEKYGPDNLSKFLAPGDYDTPADPNWNYIGTIDNDATTTQLNFLARVISAGPPSSSESYKISFVRGIEYLLAAQYPNGGWPQVWPLEGGYHDAITINDDAMAQVLELLNHVADGKGDFAFISAALRHHAAAAFDRGIRCILSTQIRSNGELTAWPQQVDPLTLEPVSARNYELPAISAGESAGVLLLLMNELSHPTAAEVHSVYAAVNWLRATAINGFTWQRTPAGRDIVPAPGAGPLWARYYQTGTNKPIFGDRDKTIHDIVTDLSLERRNGYAWYGDGAKRALDRFATWSKQHPESK